MEWRGKRLPAQVPGCRCSTWRWLWWQGFCRWAMEMRTTSSASWFPLHAPVLVLCFGNGGFLQWGMENVILHLHPRCGGRWQGPAFTSVFGGQCANGGDNGGRKDTDQPLSEDLMHNKTSSALSCMAKMPRFLKGAQLCFVDFCWRFKFQPEHYTIFTTIAVWHTRQCPTFDTSPMNIRHILFNGVPKFTLWFHLKITIKR